MNTDRTDRLPSEELRREILSHPEMPTPPGIAVQLVNLAQSSETNFRQVEELVKLDPVIAGKLMRLANSSYYTRDRKIENLRQAIGKFGLNGTLTIALTFSLIKTPKNSGESFDFNSHWLRSLASAIICKRLSQLCSAGAPETFYLAGLLQDIGVLALATAKPQLYQHSSCTAVSHQLQIAAETAELGVDHSAVGSWLLEYWEFPRLYVDATLTSHILVENESQSDLSLLNACVAVSSCLADLWKMPTIDLPAELEPIITEKLKLNDESIRSLLTDAESEMNEVSQLFGVKQADEAVISSIISQAKDTITLRMLTTEKTLTEANQRLEKLEVRTEQLEHKLEYDDLTGVHTRAFIYTRLEKEFLTAASMHRPTALIFVDLDDFKQINDQFGHGIGDKVLRLAARILQGATRENDIVARVGGEEFMVLLLDTGYVNASTICERIVGHLANASIQIEDSVSTTITASVGLSVQGEDSEFSDLHAFIDAADAACYKAKTTGKNRWIFNAA